VTLDASQQRAVELILEANVGVVTGGPGTGKTYCLGAALDQLDARGVVYRLASPTGKAARRIFESTGRAASTVHRLLEYSPRHGGFLRGPEFPIEADVVIVDEASMLDIELASALTRACQGRTRLIFVGDKDQLPPVGPGRFFGDLIDEGLVPIARLTTLHRSAAESWVATQSREINAGRLPDLAPRRDFRWLEREGRDAAVDAVVELATGGRLAAAVGLTEHQVIVPQNVGPAGTGLLNGRIQELSTPADAPSWKVGGASGERQTARLGDRVIQTRNNYQLNGGEGVMNGEIGVVVSVERDELVVRFESGGPDDVHVTYSPADARDLGLAYALTCHKMQGSETPWAVVLVHSTHTRMLSRCWLYTACTRAREGVVIVGDRTGLERAVRNSGDRKRNSSLAVRLREEAS